MLATLVVAAPAAAQSGFVSDDFDSASLGAQWSLVDPLGDASFAMVGAGTGQAYAELGVPGGVSHDQWGVSNAPRLLQPVADADMELEAAFLTTPSAKYQTQGLVVEESATEWVRADLYHDGTSLRLFAGSTDAGSSSARLNQIVDGATSFVRLNRTGDTWTVSTSTNGTSWTTIGSFVEAIAASSAGIFVGNAGPSPAYTAQFDYVFETGSPVSPEDGGGTAHAVDITVTGDGSVTRSPNLATYPEGSSVTLTATPDAGASFIGWTGDVTSTDSSVTVTVNAAMNITAAFTNVPPSYPVDVSVVGDGGVTAAPDQATYTAGSSVTLTATPDAGASFIGWSGDVTSTNPSVTVTVNAAMNITASFTNTPPPTQFVSDDFDAAVLGSEWTVLDPLDTLSFAMVGAGTGQAYAELTVPGGIGHHQWGTSQAPRLEQSVPDTDLELEVGFLSTPTSAIYQVQGLVVEESASDWVRADFYHDGTNLRVFSASTAGGVSSARINQVVPTGTSFLRLDRTGDTWTVAHSVDGLAWTVAGSYVAAFAVDTAGVFVASAGFAPGFTAQVDYVFETGSPVVPEDGNVASYPVDVTVAGPGSVAKSPDLPAYPDGSSVTLTATPDAGASFTGWTGDVTSTNPSIVVTVDAATAITATFEAAPASYPVNVNVVGDGNATKSPNLSTYAEGSSVTLTATPDAGASFTGWSGDVTSTNPSVTVTVNAAMNITATFTTVPPPSGFVSDDFDSAVLGAQWSLVDPLGDAITSMAGAGSGQAYAVLGVPGGDSHDQWGVSEAPRLMQSVPDDDFELEASFLTTPNLQYQAHGLVVEESATDWVRADLYHDGSNLRVFAGATDNGSSASRRNQIVPTNTSCLRLDRSGDTWTVTYSSDGATWVAAGSFSETLSVTTAGVFVGNAGPSPAYTAQIDYVFETGSPISPEDGVGGATYPVDVAIVGDGGVAKSPDLSSYAAGSSVTLTATPDAGASFIGWSGDVTSTNPSVTVTVNAAMSITASFTNAPATYPVNVSVVGDGSVAKSPDQPTYTAGSSVTLTATPDAGESFVGWTGDVTSTNPSVVVTVNAAVNVTATFTEAPSVDGIEIWYGSSQTFGNNGITQTWVNVLGTATDDDGISALSYTLNGGAAQGLSIGPDLRRLPDPGDFNVEIDRNDLNNGANTVVITMVDGLSNVTTETVTVNWNPTTVGLPRTVDWSSAAEIDDLVEVLDGRWDIINGQARPTQIEYDRGLLIGDQSWDDFEVEVPVTLHAIGPNSGQPLSGEAIVGFALHWQGHADSQGDQPRWRFWPTGAFAWYDVEGGGKTEILGNDNSPASLSPRSLDLGSTYIFKARAEDVPGGTQYQFKVWEQGTAEPAGWDESIVETSGPDTGSIVLLAHHFDVSFGDVVVTPLP